MVPYCDDDPLMNYGVEKYMWNGKRNVAAMLSALCAYAPRTVMIIDLLEEVLKKEPERKTLILSDRRGHLKELERLLRERGYTSIGYYVGGMKEADLKASESKDILLATLAMSAEGMDIPRLDTLVLATPVSAIEQPIGRIQRQKPSERTHTPMTIDVWDQYSLYYNQGRRRRDFYFKSGYVVERIATAKEEEADGEAEVDATKTKKPVRKSKTNKTKAPVRMREESNVVPTMENDEEDV
jgi:superfamily II DNA or RNA helicase